MYESYFHLAGKPFQLNPDPDFFFASRGHKRAMAYLEYGLHQGEGFIVITGEVGAGKTTVLRGLLRKLASLNIVHAQIVSTQVDADDLLRLVATGFGMSAEGLSKSALLSLLQRHFEGLRRQGKRALLIVDEAQNLSQKAVEELRMLSNFQIGTDSLVQSFLVGQPELRAIMQRPEMSQLMQRVTASYHLSPLERQETQDYVRHRLAHVGWQEDPRFDEGAFDRIFRRTNGVPRRINTLCDRLLLDAYLNERHTIGPADVENVASEVSEELNGAQHPVGQAAPVAGGMELAPAQNSLASAHRAFIDVRLESLEYRLAKLEQASAAISTVVSRILRHVGAESAKSASSEDQ